jgi:uncharacterized protein DUF6982
VPGRTATPPDGRSITEIELDEAQASGKPVLAFLLDPEAPWPLNRVDAMGGAPGAGEEVSRLRALLGTNYLAGIFRTPDDLASQVAAAVSAQGLTRHMVDRVLGETSVASPVAEHGEPFGLGVRLGQGDLGQLFDPQARLPVRARDGVGAVPVEDAVVGAAVPDGAGEQQEAALDRGHVADAEPAQIHQAQLAALRAVEIEDQHRGEVAAQHRPPQARPQPAVGAGGEALDVDAVLLAGNGGEGGEQGIGREGRGEAAALGRPGRLAGLRVEAQAEDVRAVRLLLDGREPLAVLGHRRVRLDRLAVAAMAAGHVDGERPVAGRADERERLDVRLLASGQQLDPAPRPVAVVRGLQHLDRRPLVRPDQQEAPGRANRAHVLVLVHRSRDRHRLRLGGGGRRRGEGQQGEGGERDVIPDELAGHAATSRTMSRPVREFRIWPRSRGCVLAGAYRRLPPPMGNTVVARFRDGRIVKGTSLDIDAGRPSCHVRSPDGKMAEVRLKDLKALFFVRSLEGDSTHDENRTPDLQDPRSRSATPVTMTFEDGEVMVGLTIRYPPNRPFFFILPVDAKSNNLRILVNRDAVVSMRAVEHETPGR